MTVNPEFWRGRRVLLTGHTGFKGAWTARWLTRLGAEVAGIALAPATSPSLHQLLGTPLAASIVLDIRDCEQLAAAVARCRPEIVLHMAAQALVPDGYRDPLGTFATNVMGTVHVLEALRGQAGVQAVVIVTTDKVYANDESGQAHRESDRLGGDDPYSASKAAAEIAVYAYARSILRDGPPLATVRAGNVIGGGDWAAGRLVPDIVRAARAGTTVALRRPDATRPWQHVLDPVHGYLLYAEALASGQDVPASLNFGPEPGASVTVREIADRLMSALGVAGALHAPAADVAEKASLALDSSLARQALGWQPRLATADALDWTAAWYKAWSEGRDAGSLTDQQISLFEARR